MNHSDINGILFCLSRVTMLADGDRDRLLYKHFNGSNTNVDSSLTDNDEIHDHEDHNHDHVDDTNDIIMAKATAMVVLFCATSICGAAPFVLNRYFKGSLNNTNGNNNARSATLVKCLLYFGGGVLLCTTFLHLLPEVREAVEGLQECGGFPKLSFPFVELLMCTGFFIMFFIEELIHSYIHRNKQQETAASAFERGHSIRHSYVISNNVETHHGNNGGQMFDDCMTNNNRTNNIKSLTHRDLYCNDIEDQKNQHQQNNHQRAQQDDSPTAPPALTSDNILPHSHSHDNHHHRHSRSHSHSHDHGHSHFPAKNNGDPEADDIITSSLRGILIVLALSVHELFEGLAIGLEGSASNVWFMFAAVSAHKLVLAFCVGVELIVARTKTYLSVLFVFTFAVVSPIGIGIGMLVSNHDSTASTIPSIILQGLACGTLLYVVFFEILFKDRSGLLAYLAIIIGFCLMFGLQRLVSGHQHSHLYSHSEDSHNHNHRHTSPHPDLNLEKQLQELRAASSSLKQLMNKN